MSLENLFLLCAVVGGAVLVCQFLLSLLGMTDSGLDLVEDLDLDAAAGVKAHGGSSWLFGVISFRTLVAAAAFFGLAGMAASSAGLETPAQLTIAVLSGAAAMYVVHGMMQLFFQLNQDNTLRIKGAVGKTGSVYLPVPAGRSGVGKIQLKLQNRIVEYPAMTSGEQRLPTGARVIVVGVVSDDTLEVEPIREAVQSGDG